MIDGIKKQIKILVNVHHNIFYIKMVNKLVIVITSIIGKFKDLT